MPHRLCPTPIAPLPHQQPLETSKRRFLKGGWSCSHSCPGKEPDTQTYILRHTWLHSAERPHPVSSGWPQTALTRALSFPEMPPDAFEAPLRQRNAPCLLGTPAFLSFPHRLLTFPVTGMHILGFPDIPGSTRQKTKGILCLLCF